MGEDLTRGHIAAPSGWVTTRVAAQALGVDPRTVRKYIKQGKLAARAEGVGVEKTYLVSIDSVYALRDTRTGPGVIRENSPRGAAEYSVSEDLVDLVRDLTSEVGRRSTEAAELRTKLELTERAESSIREALEQRLEAERLRRELAERERDELRRQLEVLEPPPDEPDGPEMAPEEPEGTETPADRGAAQTDVQRRSWWRRWFGIE